mmetsp:Transcript_3504/g.5062  ORF Transcript_3504/g.5062 Transcript_3504/m.5062 type:complete len:228 (+) Transcript_3504:85-768(+)
MDAYFKKKTLREASDEEDQDVGGHGAKRMRQSTLQECKKVIVGETKEIRSHPSSRSRIRRKGDAVETRRFRVEKCDSTGAKRVKTGNEYSRQGTLSDCKKVVDLRHVRELQDQIVTSTKVLIRIGLSGGGQSPGDKDNSENQVSSATESICTALCTLDDLFISYETLKKTCVGKTVNNLLKETRCKLADQILEQAAQLVGKWKVTSRAAIVRLQDRKKRGRTLYKRE